MGRHRSTYIRPTRFDWRMFYTVVIAGMFFTAVELIAFLAFLYFTN